MRSTVLVISALACLAASPAAALEVREHPWGPPREAGPYHHHRSFEESPWDFFLSLGSATPRNDAASFDLPRSTHPAVGMGFRYAVEPGLSVGMNAGYAVMASTTDGYGRDETRQVLAQVPVLAEVSLATPRGTFRPHVTAAGGLYVPSDWLYFTQPYENIDAGHGPAQWGYCLGVGGELRSGRLGFGLDVAKHFVNQDDGPDAKFVTVTASVHFH